MNKVTSIAHALEVLGLSIDFDKMREVLPLCGVPAKDIEPKITIYQIEKIIEANNKLNNWVCNPGDWDQRKYCVWKERKADPSKPSGFGFSYSSTFVWHTRTDVGARLEVGTHEEALYIGRDFEDLFEIAWFIIPEAAEAAERDMQSEG